MSTFSLTFGLSCQHLSSGSAEPRPKFTCVPQNRNGAPSCVVVDARPPPVVTLAIEKLDEGGACNARVTIVSPFSNNYLHIKISQQSARTSRHVRSVTPTYGGVRQWTSEGQWAGRRTHSSQLAGRAMERRTRPKQTHIWDHTCNGHCATMRTTRRPSSSDLQHVASVTSERGDRTSRIVAVCTGVAQGQPQSQPTIRRPSGVVSGRYRSKVAGCSLQKHDDQHTRRCGCRRTNLALSLRSVNSKSIYGIYIDIT